ncbi:thioredoxin domain-containing protein [bacterium]|nr:thioredoxin domain-containing protein [bacterium]
MSQNNIGTPVAIVITGLMISLGLYFGLQGVPGLSNGGAVAGVVGGTGSAGTDTGVATPIPQPTQPSVTTISVDDDPVLGDPNAPVTVIEFSDYECPFCQRSYNDMLPLLKKEYIDTGLVKLVFRDFPLSFHEPKATEEAIAANCAREQGGDAMYFKYHDAIFDKTLSNGAGPSESLTQLATDLGLDPGAFDACLANNDYAAEVQKDVADGNAGFVGGTPTYYVGASTDSGEIEAEIIVGAVPYTSIKPVIESYLPR